MARRPGAAMVIALTTWTWLALAAGLALVAYAALLLALVGVGRRAPARALVTLVPDALVLFGRLLRDARVPRRRKAALVAGIAYLAMPIDLVPDFIPIAGQVDDALIVAALLRYLARGGGAGLLAELWPGPRESLRLLVRLVLAREGS